MSDWDEIGGSRTLMGDHYPEWFYYPARSAPPGWALDVIEVVLDARSNIDSSVKPGVTSDEALAHLKPGLEGMGFKIESSKRREGKIYRPVLFGENGQARVRYEIDGWHEDLKVALEIEAGRGMKGNAFYRDLIRIPLISEFAS